MLDESIGKREKKDAYLVDRFPDPDAECLHIETPALLQRFVERWERQRVVNVCISVEHKREHWERRVDCGISKHEETVVDRNRDEVKQEDEDSLNH